MKFNIVIATMNGAQTLESTIGSIFSQTYPKWEIIVQDGGSTDGTLDILKQCGSRVNWSSEPDTGIYDAWNKAVQRVTGDWVLFLGADDCLISKHTFAQCFPHIARLPDSIRFAYGALLFDEKEDGAHLAVNRPLRMVYHNFLLNMGLPFPSTFVHASLFREHSFDASYAIAGDYDFTARLLTRDNLARLPVWVSFMRQGGISNRPENAAKLLTERLRVLRESVAPRAGEFVHAIADHIMDNDFSIEDLLED